MPEQQATALSLKDSVLLRNTHAGLTQLGYSKVQLERTVVQDTRPSPAPLGTCAIIPDDSGILGMPQYAPATAPPSSLALRDCLLVGNQGLGLLISYDLLASVDRTLVKGGGCPRKDWWCPGVMLAALMTVRPRSR